MIKNIKPKWEDAPAWANSLGICAFEDEYQNYWCWCSGTAPKGFTDVELRPYNKEIVE
jgi:hypothetical protein